MMGLVSPVRFKSFESHVRYVQRIVAQGGPHVDEYDAHLAWYSVLNSQIESGELTADQRNRLRDEFGPAYTAATLHGHAHVQPFGYAGDYQIIEKIYTKHVAPEPELSKYDLFFHQQHAPIAVRNRKRYFKELVKRLCEKLQRPISILNLASGPCREIKELLDESPSLPVSFLCVDVDRKAIKYAKSLLGPHEERVEFVEGNVFRFKPSGKFSLIWSAGLFDYFDDRTFWRILKRFLPGLESGGELVVGNFGDWNPTKGYMEALATWYLNHRSDAKLNELAKLAGATDGFEVEVGYEATRVNRFLHIGKAAKTVRLDMPHPLASPLSSVESPDTVHSERSDGV